VGYNPYRKYKATPADYAMVIVCVLVALGLVGWAFFG